MFLQVSMDGRSAVTKIHNSETAGSKPWGLLVDYEERRLYWITKLDEENQDSIS